MMECKNGDLVILPNYNIGNIVKISFNKKLVKVCYNDSEWDHLETRWFNLTDFILLPKIEKSYEF